MTKFFKAVLCAFIFSGFLFSLAQGKDISNKQWKCVTIAEVSMLDNPHPAAKIIDKLSKGTTLNVLEERKDKLINQNWLRVSHGGKSGWISETLVNKVHPAVNHVGDSKSLRKPGEKWVKIVTLENLARLNPKPDSVPQNKELARIKTGTELKIEDISILKSSNPKVLPDTKWYKVTYGGKTGWVSEYNVEVQE